MDRQALVFDVNETLLDLSALDPLFHDLFGDAAARREWFQQVLQSAFVSTVTGAYAEFGTIGGAALSMVGARRGVAVDEAAKERVRDAMRRLPPHPDVRPGLDRLRAAGFRLATLTNNPLATVVAQLASAGLADLFEGTFSADEVRRLKPAPEPYRMAADRLGVAPAGLRLVAAHGWDVAGALRAGCAAAFIARPGQVLDPLAPPPDVVAADLLDLADLLSAQRATP